MLILKFLLLFIALYTSVMFVVGAIRWYLHQTNPTVFPTAISPLFYNIVAVISILCYCTLYIL
jgi:hypothetical protein